MKQDEITKCDVVIPVYNAPEWVTLCVYSLFINTPKEYIGKIYLMNDNSNKLTSNCLNNLKLKYPDKIELYTNSKNLGFVKNVNRGINLTSGDYVLLLNTDCIISKNTIPKLISHIQEDPSIGLICPVSNNSANISLEMYEGFSYSQMDELLERKFKGKNFDACTVVGNCLMITKECLKKVGNLDESYGFGYGEETDYQFKASQKGFKSKVAIDTYVFHKSEASFGSNESLSIRKLKNRELFFLRWGDQYQKLLKKYIENDPIEYINNHISEEDKKIKLNTLFYLPFITQKAGGCHVIFDIVNRLVINGFKANILYNIMLDYKEIALFNPILRNDEKNFEIEKIITTIWVSVFEALSIIKRRKIPLINFVQGYENYFENGVNYASVELTYKLSDYSLTISEYLRERLKNLFNKDSKVIPNGVNYDLLSHKNERRIARNITFVLRGNSMKGDYILLDILRQLDNTYNNLCFTVVCMDNATEIPSIRNNSLIKIQGPLSRQEIAELFINGDIYVDASVNEGFGLMGLEAMTCGAVPVVSNSFGVNEYMIDGENGLIIKEINDSDKFVKAIRRIIDNPAFFSKLKSNSQENCKRFDIDSTTKKYIDFFSKAVEINTKKKLLDKNDLKLLKKRVSKPAKQKKTIIQKILHSVPEPLKKLAKKIINRLYRMYDHT